jgi:hypothetical protein
LLPRETQRYRTELGVTSGEGQLIDLPVLPRNGPGSMSVKTNAAGSHEMIRSNAPRFTTFSTSIPTDTSCPIASTWLGGVMRTVTGPGTAVAVDVEVGLAVRVGVEVEVRVGVVVAVGHSPGQGVGVGVTVGVGVIVAVLVAVGVGGTVTSTVPLRRLTFDIVVASGRTSVADVTTSGVDPGWAASRRSVASSPAPLGPGSSLPPVETQAS